jgi:hypothetical protein
LVNLKSKSEADVAQLVEQPIRNRQVSGSSPLVGSRFYAGSKCIDLGTRFVLSHLFIPSLADMPILGDLGDSWYKIPSIMADTQINITTISVNPLKKKRIDLKIDDHLVSIPVDADLFANFKNHFVRDAPSQKQKNEYATVMRLMVAAYKKGRESEPKK